MADNKLSCNSSKTEIVHFSSRYLQRQPIAAVNIAGSEIKTSANARDLGVTLDQCLTMSTHVSNLCKSASFALKRIGNIRQYLDQPSTEKLVHAFVSSKLDYCKVSLTRKSRKFNVFRTRPPGWLQKHHANPPQASLAARAQAFHF